MAATDVFPSSPMSPAQSAPWSSFEDYLEFPSPLPTPRLAPLAAPSLSQFSQTAQQQQQQQLSSLPNQSQQSQSSTANTSQVNAPPPPPGSSPEVLFRYYLAAELRRIGSSADDSIIDRYVAQHYDSFTKALDRQQDQASESISKPQMNSASSSSISSAFQQQQQQMETEKQGMAAFRSPPTTGPSSAPYLLSQSINPNLMELSSIHQPFTVSRMPSIPATPLLSVEMKGEHREESTVDAMSEDEEEEDTKDGLAEIDRNSKASPISSRSASHGVTGIEETPIAGSIMGPANELRPDPEAYRKLSSKEKRQLRNKISARNFRTRRKEHIAHLEQQVADRDTIIEGLRQQLALIKVQNKDLVEEARVLKSKTISNSDVTRIIEALQKGAATSSSSNTEMGPPSLLLRSSSNTSLSDTFTAASPRSNSPRPLLARPNMRKDLPSSGSVNSSKPFWGGVGGTGNNFMSVHTVLVPHLVNQDTLVSQVEQEAPADDSVTSLTRLIGEKLRVVGDDKSDKKQIESTRMKMSFSGMQEADVNEAIVSLLEEQESAPPCYSEAIASPATVATASPLSSSFSGLDLNNEQLHSVVLASLNKAFTKFITPTGAPSKGSSAAFPQLDASKVQAILDGRATLVLYDEQKGQLWTDESEDIATANSSRQAAMPLSA